MNENQSIFLQIVNKIRSIVYITLGAFDELIMRRKNHISVLSYHSVSKNNFRFSIDPGVVKKQILYLKKHYQFITEEDLLAYLRGKKQINQPSILLTFDDGYKDIMTLREFFAKQNIQPTLFVLSNPKNANWKQIGPKREFLNKKDIATLLKDGWSIQCHSATHANLAEVSMAEIKKEVLESKKSLEKLLGIKIKHFAYPRGKYTSSVLQQVKGAKYVLGFTMDDGFITRSSNPYLLPRIGVDRTHSFAEFKVAFSPSVILFRKFVKNTYLGRYF